MMAHKYRLSRPAATRDDIVSGGRQGRGEVWNESINISTLFSRSGNSIIMIERQALIKHNYTEYQVK